MEVVKNIGSIMGYIISAFTLFALIKTKFFGLMDKHTNKVNEEKLKQEQYTEIISRLDSLTAKVNSLTESVGFSNDADRQLLADNIENLFRAHVNNDQCLDETEYKRLISQYSIYHDELHGNNYITNLYEIMLQWARR